MNECEHAVLLGAYCDGELSAEVAEEMQQHVSQCPACAAELERLRALSQRLALIKPPRMSPAAVDRLHRRVDLLPGAGLRRMAEALAAVAAAILVVCSIGLARLSTRPQYTEAVPLWEVTAVSQQPADASAAGSEEQLALWIAQDLSREDAHE